MVRWWYSTALPACAVALLAAFHAPAALASPQQADTSTGTFSGSDSGSGSGSGAGSGCNVIMADPEYRYLLGCARGNVPQNYTTARQMETALNTYCAEAHKCNEPSIRLFLKGLLSSCGEANVLRNAQHKAYSLFRDLYTAVPRHESYCRRDSQQSMCLMQPGKNGTYGPRERSFTCDECGQRRVEIYANWEKRTERALGKPFPTIADELQKFNTKCPTIKATVNATADSDDSGSGNGDSSKNKQQGASAATTAALPLPAISLLAGGVVLALSLII